MDKIEDYSFTFIGKAYYAYKIPASRMEDAYNLAGAYNSGIYMYFGEIGELKNYKGAVYVGQADVREDGKGWARRINEVHKQHEYFQENQL